MTISLEPTPPYDLDLSAKIFAEGGDEHIRTFKGGTFWQVLKVDDQLVLAKAKSVGTVEQPELFLDLESDIDVPDDLERKAKDLLSSILHLDMDLKPFYKAVEGDGVLRELTWLLRGLKIPRTPTVFEALVDSIIEQQISIKVAWILENRLIKAFGDPLEIDSQTYYAFPEPMKLASLTVEDLRSIGLSARKAEYILGSSKLASDGLDLEKFKDYSDPDKVIEVLCRIRGIGVWTAELTLVRGMGMIDAIPADDLGLKRCISHYYCGDKKITGAEARKIAEAWKGWRGLASFYLIMAERLGIES
jgi:DNA-3-methyladenine glycosylase II